MCAHARAPSLRAGRATQGLRIAPPEAPVTGYMFGKVFLPHTPFPTDYLPAAALPAGVAADQLPP